MQTRYLLLWSMILLFVILGASAYKFLFQF